MNAVLLQAFVVFFAAWVLLDAEVLDRLRAPLVDRATGTLAYFVACRSCAGFWVSVAWLWVRWGAAPWQWGLDEVEILFAVNGAHVALVFLHGLVERALQVLTTMQSNALIESYRPPTVDNLNVTVQAWADANPGDVFGVSEFLDHLLENASHLTVQQLHDQINESRSANEV